MKLTKTITKLAAAALCTVFIGTAAGFSAFATVDNSELGEELWPEHEAEYAKHSERAGLDDRHRMEKRADRRRRHHRGRKPTVQRHDSSLDAARHDHQYEKKLQHPGGRHVDGKEAAGGKVHRARDAVYAHRARKEKLAGNEGIGQIFPRSK